MNVQMGTSLNWSRQFEQGFDNKRKKEKQEFITFKQYFQILEIIQQICPTLALICWEMVKNDDKVEGLLQNINYFVNDQSVHLLREIMQEGFITKRLLKTIYDTFPSFKRTFFHCLIDYRINNFVMCAYDQDRYRNIFKKPECWYYVPLMVKKKISFKNESMLQKVSADDSHICYNIIEKNQYLINWLPILLFECCHSHTIKRDDHFMYTAMSDIKVTICCKNHLDTVDILITGYKNDQKYSRSIILQVIKQIVRSHPILKRFLIPIMIEK